MRFWLSFLFAFLAAIWGLAWWDEFVSPENWWYWPAVFTYLVLLFLPPAFYIHKK